jgi:hypothetical protein
MATSAAHFVICISNEGYPASLETRKVYEEIPDADANNQDLIRVIDESGEDYLYPRSMFMPVELSGDVMNALRRAS